MIDIELYNEIREQIPNPYYPNELYHISSSCFAPESKSKYYACINNKGYLHIYKIAMKGNKILLERFRFTKKKELLYIGEYIIVEKDGELYDKYLKLLLTK